MKYSTFALSFAGFGSVNAYWLMGVGHIGSQQSDPIVSPGQLSGHAHEVFGSSAFGRTVSSSQALRAGKCTSSPVVEDMSSYWTEKMYFHWKNGSVSALDGDAVIYYLFDDNDKYTAFPENFRMISGTPTLRSYNASSFAQQAVTYLCLDFDGTTTRHNQLPVGMKCPSGIRAQINFPSCWDGKNVDSQDHKSHVDFLSDGPDQGSCKNPKFPVRLPRIFIEVYWGTGDFNDHFNDAANPQQPFVLAMGDCTGYGHHADFYNGWKPGVLDRALKECNCNEFGDPTCCGQKGTFTFRSQVPACSLDDPIDDHVTGTLSKLPGNNPVCGAPPSQPASSAASSFQSSAASVPTVVVGSPVQAHSTAAEGPSHSAVTASKVSSTPSAGHSSQHATSVQASSPTLVLAPSNGPKGSKQCKKKRSSESHNIRHRRNVMHMRHSGDMHA